MKFILKNILPCVVIVACFIAQPLSAKANENQFNTDSNAISIAIDVSGSMKKTDEQKHSIELIKMFMSLCNETDYFCVTAYNDEIVYHSGLISIGSTVEKEAVIKELDGLQFSGETDNGLGLITATNVIAESNLEYDSSFVILVTDGNTDLANSRTDRTMEDSNADMEESAEIAKENDIVINVVEYTDEYNQDTGILSVISTMTGGSVAIVDNAPQFIRVLLETFFSEYEQSEVNLQISEVGNYINRYESVVELEENQKCYEILFSAEELADCEVTNSIDFIEIYKGEHYLIQEIQEPGLYELKTVYSVEQPTITVTGNITFELEPVSSPAEIIDRGKAPTGENIDKQIYESNSELILDVSSWFEDEDEDIVKYDVLRKTGNSTFTISGSMLSIEIRDEGENRYEVTASDSMQHEKTIVFTLEVIPAWRQYQHVITTAIICCIFLAALGISACIIRKLLFENKKNKIAISGCLKARFIDLKSKNESVDIMWNLAEYPPEGVTLEELLLSKGVKENFIDVDKVCFYPGKQFNELVLVHCMEGGVFLGEQIIKANVPATICQGDTLYISFAENASEIEIQYSEAID